MGDGRQEIENESINGKKETFKNLVFHGGPGNTLEMRQFSKKSLIDHFYRAGFSKVIFNEINQDANKHGIYWHTDLDAIITVTK